VLAPNKISSRRTLPMIHNKKLKSNADIRVIKELQFNFAITSQENRFRIESSASGYFEVLLCSIRCEEIIEV